MKTYLLPLLGAAALALSQCGGSSGEYSTFSMSAASFANTTKQFVFHSGSGYGYCRIKPSTENGWYLNSLGVDSDDDSDSVTCNAYLIYEETAMGENPSSSTGVVAEVTYTSFGDGTGSLTISSSVGTEEVASVLFGVASDSDSSSTSNMAGQINVIFTGDGAGTYNGSGYLGSTSGNTSGDFRLYRGNY